MTVLQRAAALLALVAAAVTPSDLAAQGGCGGACLPCQGAPSSAWKYGGLTGANFLAYCTPNSSCSPCNFTIRDRARVEAEAYGFDCVTPPAAHSTGWFRCIRGSSVRYRRAAR
jgi:hypothetical protein